MHSKRIQKKVKDDYNQIAADFSDTRKFPWKDFEFFTPYYTADFEVLDLGCGNGRLLTFLKEIGYKTYTGLDQSKELLNQAEKFWPKSRFILGDMSDPLPFRKRFDAIFAIASFHHLPASDQLPTLKDWKMHLKPGGYLFMTNWNLHQKKYLLPFLLSFITPSYGARGVLVSWQNKLQRYYYAFTKKRLKKILKQAGFTIVFNDYVSDGKSASVWRGKNILTVARYDTDGR